MRTPLPDLGALPMRRIAAADAVEQAETAARLCALSTPSRRVDAGAVPDLATAVCACGAAAPVHSSWFDRDGVVQASDSGALRERDDCRCCAVVWLSGPFAPITDYVDVEVRVAATWEAGLRHVAPLGSSLAESGQR